MEKRNKKEKGITLIALIVTIIVLLLLVGVSILTLMGDNGLLKMANRSARDTERESLKEEIQIGLVGSYNENGFDIDKFQEEIEKNYGVKVKEEDKWEDGFRVEIEGKYGDYTVLVEKDETGKPRVEIEERGADGKLSTPPSLAESETKIEFDPSDWTNKGVKVTITLDKKINKGASTLEYSIDEGVSWSKYRKAFEVVENNTVIIARLNNGETEGGYTTATIRKIDKLPPNITNVEEVGHTTSTVTLNVIARDEPATPTDGESEIDRYYFMVDNSGKWEPGKGSENAQYTIEKLKQNKEHEIRVKVTDKAGNETIREEEIKVTTSSLQDLGQETSNTVIDFDPDDWTSDGVTVTITTNAEIGDGTKLQYSIDEGISWTDYNDTPFKVTENNTVIIARLYDGTNESGYATGTVTMIDKINPYDVQMEVIGEKKTSKIEVRVSAKDSLSGIKRYKFSYSINGGENYFEAGTKEVEPKKESTITYEYENLTDDTNYTLKVEAYDYVNNKNEEEVTTKGSTKAMPNVNEETLKISFTPTTWTPEVTVTITPKGIDVGDSEIQYMIEGEDWTPYNDTPFKVKKKGAIVARLYDGTNESNTSTGTITLVDTVEPTTVNISKNAADTNSITVNVTAADGSETKESGKSGIKKLIYYYSTNDGEEYEYKDEVTLETSNTGTYTSTFKYEGLAIGKTYKLKVEAYDEAGNMKSAETEPIQMGTPPVMSEVTPSRAWTSSAGHSITLTVSATDNEGGKITYNVQYGTNESYGSTATGSGTAGSSTTIKLTGLSQYTRYYYKVTATDETGITSTNYKDGDYKTYCIGTYCYGGYPNAVTCTASGCVNGKIAVANGTTCTATGCVNGKVTTTVPNGATCTAQGCNGGKLYSACGGTLIASASAGGANGQTCNYCGTKITGNGARYTLTCTRCGTYYTGSTSGIYGVTEYGYYHSATSTANCITKFVKEYNARSEKCQKLKETGSCSVCDGDGLVDSTTKTNCTTCDGDGLMTRYDNCTNCGGDGLANSLCRHNIYPTHYWCTITGHGGNYAGEKHGET